VVTDETDTLVVTRFGDSPWGGIVGHARLDQDNSGIPTPVAAAVSAAIAFPGDYDATATDYSLFVAVDTGGGDGDVYRIEAAEAPASSIATDLDIGDSQGLNNVDVTGLAARGESAGASLLAGTAGGAEIYFSTDGGHTWRQSHKGPTGGSRTHVLMTGPGNDGPAYAATSGGESAFSISHDGGDTWNQIGLIDTAISSILDLAPSPSYSQDGILFMLTFGSGHSLWRSRDAGASWERVLASSLPDVDDIDLVALSPRYGQGSQAMFAAGSSLGRPTVWKSTDDGQSFTARATFDPDSGIPLPIEAWAVTDDNSLFIGSRNGSDRLIFRTTNSGFTYAEGSPAGSHALTSLVLSPDSKQDGPILAGDSGGWVYKSDDDGASFEPVPRDATSPPFSGVVKVAFDPAYSRNNIVYAASSAADEGVYRFTIGSSQDWERLDGNLPGGGTLEQVLVAPDGTLYAANSQADGGMERSLNPTFSLGPTFETVTRGLSEGATLSELWWQDHRLWSIDTTHAKLLTFLDSLTSPVALASPADEAAGIGSPINYTIANVHVDWEAQRGATNYRWQLDHDTDFSSVPDGFEGTTKASSTRLPTLEPATTYYWRVRVTEPALSPWSDKWSFTTSLETEAATIRLDSPNAGATGVPIYPLFQWSAIPGAHAYELLVAADAQFAHPLVAMTGDHALPATAWQSDIILGYDTTCFWKVRAISPATRSAWSPVGSFTTTSYQTSLQPEASSPVLITVPAPLPPAQTVPPPALTSPPVPPAPPPAAAPAMPDWALYLLGGMFLIIVLLVVVILVLALNLKRG
jgi:photosystem II stability/assembly factor-like uncharacterized protein